MRTTKTRTATHDAMRLTRSPRPSKLGRLIALVGTTIVVAWLPPSAWAQLARPGFDHDLTRFPLTGRHLQATCENCHFDGAFAGDFVIMSSTA